MRRQLLEELRSAPQQKDVKMSFPMRAGLALCAVGIVSLSAVAVLKGKAGASRAGVLSDVELAGVNLRALKALKLKSSLTTALSLDGDGSDMWCTVLTTCDQAANRARPWCDNTKSFQERAEALVDEIDVEHWPYLLVNNERVNKAGGQSCGATAIPELGIEPKEWWNEALHGLGYSPGNIFKNAATSFPQVISTAASFNRTLFGLIGGAIGAEARRAFYDHKTTQLTYWTPNINIFRDPRWGRGQETPGEDPYLTGEYAKHFVQGIQ